MGFQAGELLGRIGHVMQNNRLAQAGALGATGLAGLGIYTAIQNSQAPPSQTAHVQVENEKARGQGPSSAPSSVRDYNAPENIRGFARMEGERPRSPVLDRQDYLKEQTKLYNEADKLERDLAFNSIYRSAVGG